MISGASSARNISSFLACAMLFSPRVPSWRTVMSWSCCSQQEPCWCHSPRHTPCWWWRQKAGEGTCQSVISRPGMCLVHCRCGKHFLQFRLFSSGPSWSCPFDITRVVNSVCLVLMNRDDDGTSCGGYKHKAWPTQQFSSIRSASIRCLTVRF